VILVDSNVPMYVIGSDHPHKRDAQRLLEQFASARERLVADAEVFQEILHRYRAINRPDAIQPAYDLLLDVVDDVSAAKDLLLARWELSARDAVHVAVMHANEITRIVSFDRDFDRVPGVERLS
jgi:predicted nucleic acid-binding protein